MFGYAMVYATTRSEKLVLTYLPFQALVDQRNKMQKNVLMVAITHCHVVKKGGLCKVIYHRV